MLLLLLSSSCATQLLGASDASAPALGSPCRCTGELAECASCASGQICFDAYHDGSGVCTRLCKVLDATHSDCPDPFECTKSAADDYATGPYCFPR